MPWRSTSSAWLGALPRHGARHDTSRLSLACVYTEAPLRDPDRSCFRRDPPGVQLVLLTRDQDATGNPRAPIARAPAAGELCDTLPRACRDGAAGILAGLRSTRHCGSKFGRRPGYAAPAIAIPALLAGFRTPSSSRLAVILMVRTSAKVRGHYRGYVPHRVSLSSLGFCRLGDTQCGEVCARRATLTLFDTFGPFEPMVSSTRASRGTFCCRRPGSLPPRSPCTSWSARWHASPGRAAWQICAAWASAGYILRNASAPTSEQSSSRPWGRPGAGEQR